VIGSAKKLDFLVNWSEPGNKFAISKITAIGKKGRKLATLSGKGKPKKLKVTRARGDTFQSLSVRKPKGTKKVAFRVKALRVTTAERTLTELSQRR
jgi:hypothetical protein